MQNYEKVDQWATGLNSDKALYEIEALKLKYPWLKCDESHKLILMIARDMPKIISIIKLQEKQNALHRRFVEVSRLADETIVPAIEALYNIK